MCAKRNSRRDSLVRGKGSQNVVSAKRRKAGQSSLNTPNLIGPAEPIRIILSRHRTNAILGLKTYTPMLPVMKKEIVLGVLPIQLRVQYALCLVLMHRLHRINNEIFAANRDKGKGVAGAKSTVDKLGQSMYHVMCALDLAQVTMWASVRVLYPRTNFMGVAVRSGWKVVAYPDLENMRKLSTPFMSKQGVRELVCEFSSPAFM